jgi:hypothetical protein
VSYCGKALWPPYGGHRLPAPGALRYVLAARMARPDSGAVTDALFQAGAVGGHRGGAGLTGGQL